MELMTTMNGRQPGFFFKTKLTLRKLLAGVMTDRTTLSRIVTQNLVYEISKALALSQTKLFGVTPRVTFGDLISAENIINREHNVLKTHLAATLSHVASYCLRQV
jgi:hypothetical protein